MVTCIQACLDAIEVGHSNIHGRMEVLPLFAPKDAGPEYLMLCEALAQGIIRITEVSREGKVPELKVTNRSQTPVLLIDGEELAGAKQNRVLNTSILVPGHANLAIPVSCTEHGRWSDITPFFHDSDVMMDYKIRAKKMAAVGKSIRHEASFRSDQLEIWREISEMSRKAKVASPTGSMKDVFEAQKGQMERYLAAFPLHPGQQGVIVYMDRQPAGIEFLYRPEAYAPIHEKLIRSYVMEAHLDEDCQDRHTPERPEKPPDFLRRVLACTVKDYRGVGLGTEHRFEGAGIVGSALAHDGRLVHLACFAAGDEEGPRPDDEPVAVPRARHASHARGKGGKAKDPAGEKGA